VGWFRPLGRGIKCGTLIAVPIEIHREEKRTKGFRKLYSASREKGEALPHIVARDLVVSVPGVCGNAVQRNRFKRIVKARFAKSVLNGPRSGGIDESQENIAGKSPRKQSRKGLWIRLLNRHRLGQKILSQDWQRSFDKIENHFCSKSSF